ncbi:unnamed protein product [Lupinus luteus]|uniref:VQ domain-containing protein n=1 Tax=Lupinus luteus TaxID=3873 RepID=A0AAV1X983_LUPLU
MDSGNSRSISSSGDEEYDSRVDHTTLLPSTFLDHPPIHFGQSSSLNVSSHHHNPSFFDLSSSYLHSIPNTNPNSFLNLDTITTSTSQGKRPQPNCTDPANLQGLFPPPHGLSHDENKNARVVSAALTNNASASRNSKKRTRASRRAPTTVLTTDTSNFRAMVQEFTGIPAPPFSGSSSYSITRRLDLLPGSSSSLRTSASHHLDTTPSFYPLRPSPQKLHHQQNHFPSSLLLHNNNMVDVIASLNTNNNNSINYELPPDPGLPYHHNSQNVMLSMQQNYPNILPFHQTPLHSLGNHVLSGFGAKSPASLSVQSLEELGMNHGQVNSANLVGASSVSVPRGHSRLISDQGNGRELNFSKASASSSLNHEKNLENNSTSTTRGEGNVDSWIPSSD